MLTFETHWFVATKAPISGVFSKVMGMGFLPVSHRELDPGEPASLLNLHVVVYHNFMEACLQ